VLAAIAQARGLPPDAAVDDDPAAGTATLEAAGSVPLKLIESSVVSTPGVWLFDEKPVGPRDIVPVWRGWLVVARDQGKPNVVPLGDRVALAEAWPSLAGLLTAVELASLIARYFGRDAGLPVHHTVVANRSDVEQLLARPEELPAKVGPPRLTEPREADDLVTLSFFTSFGEPDEDGAPSFGLAYWKARWAPELPLAWDALVIARYLRHRLAP
jgi:hypothetical protein